MAVLCLNDDVARFCTRMKFSHQYNNQAELMHQYDLLWYDILWWYYVNECRAMTGDEGELALERKSPQCHDIKNK